MKELRILYAKKNCKGEKYMLYIANAFSLQMLENDAVIKVWSISQEEASRIVRFYKWQSCVGHADTAMVFGNQLGIEIPLNRINLKVKSEDNLLVGQLVGGRLPEGATTLPDGFSIKWMMVAIE